MIDYTIELYKVDTTEKILDKQELFPESIFEKNEDFHIIAESDSIQDGKRILENTIVYVQDSTKYAKVESPFIIYQPEKKRIDSEYGSLKIYDKISNGAILRTDVSYNKLIVFKKKDSVGLRIIIKNLSK